MNKIDKNRPVSSIKHDDKRAAILDSTHQGEEQMKKLKRCHKIDYDETSQMYVKISR